MSQHDNRSASDGPHVDEDERDERNPTSEVEVTPAASLLEPLRPGEPADALDPLATDGEGTDLASRDDNLPGIDGRDGARNEAQDHNEAVGESPEQDRDEEHREEVAAREERPGPTPVKDPLRALRVLVALVLAVSLTSLLIAMTGTNGRAAGVQAVRSLVSQPLVASATAGAGQANTVSITAEGGRRPVLFGFHATSGFPQANTAAVVTITGVEDARRRESALRYILVQTNDGGSLIVDFPQGVSGKANGTISVTIEAAPTGGSTALVLQGYQV